MPFIKLLGAIVLSLTLTNAYSGTVTYDDTTIYWEGNESSITAQNSSDTNGQPKIDSMTVNTSDSNVLTSVVINFESMIPSNWLSGFFDSLFINTDGDGTGESDFEYYVQSALGPQDYTLYDVDGLTADSTTTITYSGLSGVPRMDHINGYLDSTLAGTDIANMSDLGLVDYDTGSLTLTYDLASFGITLDDNYAISYMNSCANDVIVGATPIPTTLLLFGSALFGIFGFKKFQTEA